MGRAMRGRKPTPTVIRALQGNPGKRPLNQNEPQPPATEDGFESPPPEIAGNRTAAAEWVRLVPMLRRCRQITQADRIALIELCAEWAIYQDAMSQVVKLGLVVKAPSGYPILNPYRSVALRALAQVNKMLPELGLTPSSRSRVKTEGPGPDGDDFSVFDVAPVPRRPQ
jgi:P27 family predicted phage terminase small subunit